MSTVAPYVRIVGALCLLAILASDSVRSSAQSNSVAGQSAQSDSHSTPPPKSAETRPKLTPDQERGQRLLKAAVAQAAGLQPDMRAFVIWRASNAYSIFDAKEADRLAEDAFVASVAIDDPREDDHCKSPGSAGDIKGWIQHEALAHMIRQDKVSDVERLLPQATSRARSQVSSELIQHYIAKKDFGRAQAFLAQLADSEMYPFRAAADLLLALGADKSTDRAAIFSQAVTNFEQHAGASLDGFDDVGRFLERTWPVVPAPLVLDAVDRVLEEAKSHQEPWHFSTSSARGSTILNSYYAFRLFEVLPILEELDKDKAEELLRENTEVANQLQSNPKGLESFDISSGYSVGMSTSPIAPIAAQQQMQAQAQDRVELIVRQAASDPASALANALALPVQNPSQDSSPRAWALLEIAWAEKTKNPSVTKSALDGLENIEDQLTAKEVRDYPKLAELYLSLGDVDGAKKAITIEVKAAEKLYESDTDADDPNGAFKGTWPSTDLWRKCVQQAAKISPAFAEEIIAGIQDEDIGTFEKISYAGALVGFTGANFMSEVEDCRKDHSSSESSFESVSN